MSSAGQVSEDGHNSDYMYISYDIYTVGMKFYLIKLKQRHASTFFLNFVKVLVNV
jgi:hypothetical protein